MGDSRSRLYRLWIRATSESPPMDAGEFVSRTECRIGWRGIALLCLGRKLIVETWAEDDNAALAAANAIDTCRVTSRISV